MQKRAGREAGVGGSGEGRLGWGGASEVIGSHAHKHKHTPTRTHTHPHAPCADIGEGRVVDGIYIPPITGGHGEVSTILGQKRGKRKLHDIKAAIAEKRKLTSMIHQEEMMEQVRPPSPFVDAHNRPLRVCLLLLRGGGKCRRSVSSGDRRFFFFFFFFFFAGCLRRGTNGGLVCVGSERVVS